MIAIEGQRIFREKRHGMDFVAINYIHSLASLLKEEKPDEKLIVFAKKTEFVNREKFADNVKVVFIPGLPYPLWEQVLLPLYCLIHGIKLLHCTSNTAPVFCPCTLVLTLHDVIFMESNPMKEGSTYQKYGNLYRRWVVPLVVKKAASIITVSHYEEGNIAREFPKQKDKIQVVYNAANEHFYQFPNPEKIEATVAKYKIPQPYFVFLGNTDPKKNVDNVFKAMYLLYQDMETACPVLLVPDYPDAWLDNWYEKNRVEEAFKNHIFCSGYIDNKDLQAILHKSIAFLYPSKRESFGIPILEGFLSRVPVITSNAASMPEVAGEAAILIDPLEPQSLYKAMREALAYDDSSRQKFIDKGLSRAKDFSWSQSALALKKIYQSLG